MTRLSDTNRARSLLGKRGAFQGAFRWPWMASGMGTDDAHTPATNRSRHNAQRVVEKVGRSITNSETPHQRRTSKADRHGERTRGRHAPQRADRTTSRHRTCRACLSRMHGNGGSSRNLCRRERKGCSCLHRFLGRPLGLAVEIRGMKMLSEAPSGSGRRVAAIRDRGFLGRTQTGRPFWTMGFEPGLFVRPPLRLAWIELRARIGLCRCPAGSPACRQSIWWR